jgi:hypothetical protein
MADAQRDTRGPLVSVVMPVFDGETYLAQAIESVLGQTFQDFELIAVDDGSHDGSSAIVERFSREDPRVRLISNEKNLGISATLNHGWRAARAPLIARLDADDISLPDRLARQVAFLDAHPSVAVVGGALVTMDATGRRGSVIRFPTTSRAIRSTLLRHNCLAHPSVMLRRVALEAVGGYRFDCHEDYDLWLRLSERFELANLPEPLILYRLHPGQISMLALEERERPRLAVRDAARARSAAGHDPLAGIQKLTPAILERFTIDEAELAGAVEHECLARAAMLADLGYDKEAVELVERASDLFGSRARRAFAAARELNRAETLRSAQLSPRAVAHVLKAFGHEPRYTSARLSAWLGDRLQGRGPLRRL